MKDGIVQSSGLLDLLSVETNPNWSFFLLLHVQDQIK